MVISTSNVHAMPPRFLTSEIVKDIGACAESTAGEMKIAESTKATKSLQHEERKILSRLGLVAVLPCCRVAVLLCCCVAVLLCCCVAVLPNIVS